MLPDVEIDTSCSAGQNLVGSVVPFVDCRNGEVGVTNPVTDAIQEGVGKVMSGMSTFWINTPSPDLTTGRIQAGGRSPVVAFLQDSLVWYTAAFMVIGLMIAALRLMFASTTDTAVTDASRGLVNFLVTNGAGVGIIASLVIAADKFSIWIIDQATDGPDFGAGLTRLVTGGGGLGLVLLIIIGILSILVSLAQMALLLWRNAALVVLCGTLPLAASASMTNRGQEWFTTQVGWIIAYIAYKPAASIIYAASFKLVAQGADSDIVALVNALTGLMLMLLAVVALPALIRLAVPATQRVAQGRGAGAAMASAAMVAIPVVGGAAAGAAAASAAAGAANSASQPAQQQPNT